MDSTQYEPRPPWSSRPPPEIYKNEFTMPNRLSAPTTDASPAERWKDSDRAGRRGLIVEVAFGMLQDDGRAESTTLPPPLA